MAQYSTSLEVIVNNLCEDRTKPLKERVESARVKIFDFEYPVPASQNFSDDFKKYFETAFINHYLFDEIAQETVARFKQRLYSKLLIVMPKYQSIFDILNNFDYSKALDTNDYKDYNKRTIEDEAKATTGTRTAGSQLPETMLAKGGIGEFANVGYANSAELALTENETNRNETEINEHTTTGRNQSQIELISKIDSNFNSYFEELINEFKPLFSYLWF